MNFRKIERQYKFNDKSVGRHKHNYVVDAVAEVTHGSERLVLHYNILKCDKCSSFYCKKEKGSMSGYTNDVDPSLPVVKLKTNHKHLDFKGLKLIE